MRFKELDIKPQGSRFSRMVKGSRFRKTLIAIVVGALIGFGIFYLTEGRSMDSIPVHEIFKSIAIGGFFGFFVTNSPCARGRC